MHTLSIKESGLFLLVETLQNDKHFFSGPKETRGRISVFHINSAHIISQTMVSVSGFHMNTFSYELTYLYLGYSNYPNRQILLLTVTAGTNTLNHDHCE